MWNDLRRVPRLALIGLVVAYQQTISPDHGFMRYLRRQPACRYHPTCSEYAIEALDAYGVIRGMWLAMKRVSRCTPWHDGGYDPVPSKHESRTRDVCT